MMRSFRSSKTTTTRERRRPIESGKSTSSFSYYTSKRSNLPTNREVTSRTAPGQPPKKPSRIRFAQLNFHKLGQQFGSILLAVVLIACVISVLQVDNTPRIVMLNNTSGLALHSTTDYQRAVMDSLKSSLLNSNKITVNTHHVVSDLRTKFPEIYDASLVLPLVGHRPTVYIELTRPALVLQTAVSSTVVDSSGRVLTASTSKNLYDSFKLPVIYDQSTISSKVGAVALSSDDVAFVEDIARQFNSQGVAIDKFMLPTGKEELDVYPKGAKYYVRFNTHETTSREQAGTFFAVRQQLQKQGTHPKQYVDVRIIGRAYYL